MCALQRYSSPSYAGADERASECVHLCKRQFYEKSQPLTNHTTMSSSRRQQQAHPPPPTRRGAAVRRAPASSSTPVATVREPSVVISAAVRAQETLERLREEERVEEERARDDASRHVLSGELAWQHYLEPPDTRNIDDCIAIDKYNHSVFMHNNAMLERVNALLADLSLPEKRCDPPPKFAQNAKALYEKMMWNDEFRLLQAIVFLAKRDIFIVRDYNMETDEDAAAVPKRADAIAEQEFIAATIESSKEDGGVDISTAVGINHALNCTCENRWDGESERCIGNGVRIRWKRLTTHHFLRPCVVPEKY